MHIVSNKSPASTLGIDPPETLDFLSLQIQSEPRKEADRMIHTTFMTQSDERKRPMMPAMNPYVVLIIYPVTTFRVDRKKSNIRKHVVQRNINLVSDG